MEVITKQMQDDALAFARHIYQIKDLLYNESTYKTFRQMDLNEVQGISNEQLRKEYAIEFFNNENFSYIIHLFAFMYQRFKKYLEKEFSEEELKAIYIRELSELIKRKELEKESKENV